MSGATRLTTWGAARRLARSVYQCMPIAAEHGPRGDLANRPASRFNRLLRHGIEEVLA